MLKTLLLLLAAFFSGSHQQCFTNNDIVSDPTLNQYNAWVGSTQNFSVTLLKAVTNNAKFSDVIFSPSSIREALLLEYFGAAKETEKSLVNVLQLPAGQSKPLTWKIYKKEKLMNLRKQIKDYPLRSVNKLFLSSNLKLRACMHDKFENELEIINKGATLDWTKNHINRWVERETGGKIKDFFKNFNSQSQSNLVNAVSFDAKWVTPFDPNNTQVLQFTPDGGSPKSTTYMVKDGVFKAGYSKELEARFVLLPYQLNRTGMIVVRPDKDLKTLILTLNDSTLAYITNRHNYKSSYFRLFLPKIMQRNNVDLKEVLRTLGAGKVFTPDADFSGFTGTKDVFISEVIHQAVVKLDEEGSTLTSGSGFAGVNVPRSKLEHFILDRPFLYIMYDFLARKVLLMGIFSNTATE